MNGGRVRCRFCADSLKVTNPYTKKVETCRMCQPGGKVGFPYADPAAGLRNHRKRKRHGTKWFDAGWAGR